MTRIFNTLSILTSLMLLMIGGAAYWFLQSNINQTSLQTTEARAKGVALSISSQVNMLQNTLAKMALSPEIITAIESHDELKMTETADMLQQFIPDVISLKILPADTDNFSQSNISDLGNADLIMVLESISTNKNLLPVIQGLNKDRHLAIVSVVRKNDTVIGVIFANLNFNFLQTALNSFQVPSDVIELQQNKIILAVTGNLSSKNETSQSLNIEGTSWTVHYWSSEIINMITLLYFLGLIILSMLLVYLICFSGKQKLQGVLKQDFNNIDSIIKDLLSEKNVGSYPMYFDEMNDVATKIVQLKHDLTREETIQLQKTIKKQPTTEESGVDFIDTSAFNFDT